MSSATTTTYDKAEDKVPDEYVLRTVPSICMPRYAVVKCEGFAGEDVAWFFTKRDALDYIKWKSHCQFVGCGVEPLYEPQIRRCPHVGLLGVRQSPH